MSDQRWRHPRNPPTDCKDLCLTGADVDAAHVAARDAAYAAAVQLVASETGRWGLVLQAVRWCVPSGCTPCMPSCGAGCAHGVALPLPSCPAVGAVDVFGEGVPGVAFGPFKVFQGDTELFDWSVTGSTLRVPSGYTSSTSLGEWPDPPTFDGPSSTWTVPASNGLVAVGTFGVMPTTADLIRVDELTCLWAREIAGVCDDEKPTRVSQSGPDGSVTYSFNDKRLHERLAALAAPKVQRASLGLSVLTGPATQRPMMQTVEMDVDVVGSIPHEESQTVDLTANVEEVLTFATLSQVSDVSTRYSNGERFGIAHTIVGNVVTLGPINDLTAVTVTARGE